MNNIDFSSDAGFQRFPIAIQENVKKIHAALLVQEAGGRLDAGFLVYALACKNLSLQNGGKGLSPALQTLSERVQGAWEQVAPTALLKALREDKTQDLENILKISDLQNKKLKNGEMPIHFAIRCGSKNCVKYLLKHAQADPLAKDHQGLTAFDHAFLEASLSHNPAMPRLVLGASLGCDIPDSAFSNLDPVDRQEFAALSQQIQKLRYPPVAILPQLHALSFLGDLQGVETLLREGASVNGSDLSGLNALHFAVLGGKEEVVHYLLKKGARPDSPVTNGMTALHLAAIGGSEGVLRLLLDTKRCDPNALDYSGRTPLHFALAAEQLPAARLLVKRGGDLLARTSMKSMPLSILEGVYGARAAQKDPLKLDTSACLASASYIASEASRYMGWEQAEKFFAALPVVGTFFGFSRRQDWMKIPGTMGLFAALGAYGQDDPAPQQLFAGIHTATMGKSLYGNLKSCWANRHVETYRPLRNACVHIANALFSTASFLQMTGFINRDSYSSEEDRIERAGQKLADLGCKAGDTNSRCIAKAKTVLGIHEGNGKCKEAYWTLAKRYHPDKCKKPDGSDCGDGFMKRINSAYEVLNSCNGYT